MDVPALARLLGMEDKYRVLYAIEKRDTGKSQYTFKIAEVFGIPAETLSSGSDADIDAWLAERQAARSAEGSADGPKTQEVREKPAAYRLTGQREVDLIDNPDYPAIRCATIKASAGITGFAIDYDTGIDGDATHIVLPRTWFKHRGYRPDRMIAMRVHGASMEPTLHDGDLIVVNMDSTNPRDGVVYLALYEGEPVVKRLLRDAGAWWLCSDHPDQRRFPRKLCDEATRIVGEVVCRQSEHI